MFFALSSKAQLSVLPITDMPNSAMSLSLANSYMGLLSENYVHNNPSAIFYSQANNIAISSAEINNEDSNNYRYYNFSAGYKFRKIAILVGIRYLDMGEFQNEFNSDLSFNDNLETIKLKSYSLDLGLSYKLNDRFAIYVKSSCVEENSITDMNAMIYAGGVYYYDSFNIFNKKVKCSLGSEYSNIGKVKYSGKSTELSEKISIGGSISCDLDIKNSASLFVSGGGYRKSKYIKTSEFVKIGVEYSYKSRLYFRIGGNSMKNDNYLCLGLSYKYNSFVFSFANRFKSKDKTTMYNLTVAYNFKRLNEV
jgi:hypothetical protein